MTRSDESGLHDAILDLKQAVRPRPEARARLSRALRAAQGSGRGRTITSPGMHYRGRHVVLSPLAFAAVALVFVTLGAIGARFTGGMLQLASDVPVESGSLRGMNASPQADAPRSGTGAADRTRGEGPNPSPMASSSAQPSASQGANLSGAASRGDLVSSGRVTAPAAPREAGSASPALVSFLFVSDDARSVVVVGDFNGWNPTATPLTRTEADGTWRVSLPLSPGLYNYSFLIDGVEWRSDPVAPAAPGDDFGQPSSVLFVQPAT